MVRYVVRPEDGKNMLQRLRIRNVHGGEASLARDIPPVTGRQVVNNRRFIARRQRRSHNVRTDETGASGYQ